MELHDITGQKFNRLTAIEISHRIGYRTYWLCICDCGNKTSVAIGKLRNGSTKSCGCRRSEIQREGSITHGKSRTKVYNTWARMIGRCCNPNNPKYSEYGGRGIKICDLWRHNFEAFYEYVGDPPTTKHQIDRIDVNGNYDIGNVRWVDLHEQAQNKRNSKWWFCNGIRYESCKQASLSLGIDCTTVFRKCKYGVDGWYSINKYMESI